MSHQLPLARTALLLIVLMLLITPGSAAGTEPSEWEYPETIPGDPVPEYIWNVPLKLILLDFVFMTAPLLFLPVQFLISVTVWLILGQRRISRKNVLEHDTRRAAYLCIRENPGINYAFLSCRLGVNAGTLRYHLAILRETGKILAEHDHGQVRYYANGKRGHEGESYSLSGTRREILDLITRNPGIARKDVASALGISGASVTWHMSLLIRDGAVRSEKDGRLVRYFPRRGIVFRANRGADATG
ncbi:MULTISPECIES: winged helix-turn-helix transcriptional regulator [unclassified Methanoculleus]|uniref:winged helix-turn-helix transcriptional regulator n=1 Tax=unclassified Methanoculleus TaxID=2619537 RepID=UPI0025F42ED1|nr:MULTISPECIES: winged helix-turn-helix transcriptional regulator [unclassified Methanoculleus]MCK9317993.1 winged helix-turn-helix transcriptional regulator [Methanoculleus sp.]MDD2254089.1 winged helix-turn-helix transcriptional regulator [Methanoculleus sp.]MDD2786880.1 winged helix-turn-helix transcriptional regulator [Methanoculleus sp.]MDD3215352.1 winged helix-turn-helix transcriptional regulator [Methanoculleus sp.]MDD4314323.1 winged helix-turn-helix transcriptional regulator [Methan